jgi:hypothetical protein
MESVKHFFESIPKEVYVFIYVCYLLWVAVEFINDFVLNPKQEPGSDKPIILNLTQETESDIISEIKPGPKPPSIDRPVKPIGFFFNPDRLKIVGTKISYIRAVINWCRKNIPHPTKSLHPLYLEVKYYRHQKTYGVYFSGQKTIRIYVNNHSNVSELTDTIIHEYHHYMYMRSNAHQYEYNRFTNNVGYLDNPYEKAARECASKYYKACVKDLYMQGILE